MSPPLVPPEFAAGIVEDNGSEGRAWIERLPQLVAEACQRWSVSVSGPSMHGVAGLVVPVRASDGTESVLKVSWPHEEAAPESAALRCWNGRGAVQLLADDAATWTLLLERLDPTRTLESLPDVDEAVSLAAGLLERLHVAAPGDVPAVAELARRWTIELPEEWERFGRPCERRLVDQAVATCTVLGADDSRNRLLHGDFHYANVLAGEREPWLAIDPKPLVGDPAFDVAPLFRNRWEDLTATGDLPAAIRRRFDQIVDIAALDPGRTRSWTITRAVANILWAIEHNDKEFATIERTIAETLGT